MVLRIRRCPNIQIKKIITRNYSSPALSLHEDALRPNESDRIITNSRTTISAKSTSTINTESIKVNDFIKLLPSERFNNEVYVEYSSGSFKLEDLSKTLKLKHEIYKLLESNNVKAIADLFLQWSEKSLSNLLESLTRQEFSYIIKRIIICQTGLLQRYALDTINEKTKNSNPIISKLHDDTRSNDKVSESRVLLDSIRKIYSNLIYTDHQDYIYQKSKRSNLYNSPNLTGYTLQVEDYENLIFMEYHNLKFDLAAKWFHRFELEHPENYRELMTFNMWLLKFKLHAGGSPLGWVSKSTNTFQYYRDPKFSGFKQARSYKSILNDFLIGTNQSIDDFTLNNELAEVLIYSISYSGELNELYEFIELTYGINSKGELNPEFKRFDQDDSRYPNIKVLKAIIVSLSSHQEFFKSLKYITAFEDHYGVSINDRKSISFWEELFKGCDLSTKYNQRRSLAYYLQQTSKTDSNKVRRSSKTLQEVQQDVNFDYEGYLTFMDELKSERINTFNQLWTLYQQETGGHFSLRIYKLYFDYLKEELNESSEQTEELYYSYLTCLLNQYHKFAINHDQQGFTTRDGFNFGKQNKIDQSIGLLYEQTMKSLIDYKWKATYAGQCIPLINKWSLDEEMNDKLMNWWKTIRAPRYREMIEKKRVEFMANLRNEDKEDDESLLDLL
ncbi:mitochondrial ATPase expression-domain-containing protein [Scheffersomyces coipomensis]|uniref:mitochondrial ATPase expression-domain-containing protein n=1 Tax=Scheffersomyces coipomensis TaxID=1788519 RepID=UPI00315C5AF2